MPEPEDKSALKVLLAQALKNALFGFLNAEVLPDSATDVVLGDIRTTGENTVPIARKAAGDISATTSSMLLAVEPFIRVIVDVLLQLTTPVATSLLRTIGEARKDSAGPINEVIVEAMGELLGVTLTADDVPTGGDLQSNAARARAIGGKLHEVLIAEFTPDGEVTPESGEKAARAFTGFNINFGVTTAFIAIVAEMFSLGQLKEFRELGVTVAENLGLGRLHRQAMKPLMDNTVSKPYDRLLRKRYRQDKLTESQYVKALHRGKLDEQEVRDALAEKGYKDSYIDEIIQQLTAHLTDNELERLVRHGVIEYQLAIDQMRAEGWPEETAQRKLKAIELGKVDSLVDSLLSFYRGSVGNGFMDVDDFRKVLDELPISEAQKVWEIRLAGAPLEFPSKNITLAQLQTAHARGIVDLSYFDAWAKREGYSDEDILNLELLTFLKEDDATTKAKAKADAAQRKKDDACAKLKAKGLPCPP